MNDYLDRLTVSDLTGQDAQVPTAAWISVPDVAQRLSTAGLPRNKRTIRRYCERGDLECRKTENALHQPQYFIDPRSVEVYIAQQKSLMTTSPDQSGLVRSAPNETGLEYQGEGGGGQADFVAMSTGSVRSQPGPSGQNRISPRGDLVDQLQARLEDKDAEINFLRGELMHRRTTDTALHDVILAFRANAEAQRLAAAPNPEGQGTTHREPPPQ